MKSYCELMRYYHSEYPYLIPSENCIEKNWMMNVILPVLQVAEDNQYWSFIGSYKLHRYDSLLSFLNDNISRAAEGELSPEPLEWIWRYTKVTPLNNMMAIIIGQDPYCKGPKADGLAFSSADSNEVGASLQVIFQAIETQTNYVPIWNGNLTRWARRGALLIDAIPTTGSTSGSHKNFGWVELNNMILYALSDYYELIRSRQLFVMAWGHYAKKIACNVLFDDDVQLQLQTNLLDPWFVGYRTQTRRTAFNDRFHKVVSSVHPSPLNETYNFIRNGHFAQFQEFIEDGGLQNLPWV